MNKNRVKSLTSNSIYYLIYNSLNAFFPLITGIYVTHILLAEDIGAVEAARNLAQYFVILAFLGLPTYGLREIAKYRKDKTELNKIYSELMIINTVSTCVFLALYLVLITSVTRYRNNYLLYLITGGSIALNFLNNSWLFEGLEEFKYVSVRNIVFKVVSFILLITFVKKKEDYLIYAIITICGTAGNYFVNIINTHKYVQFSVSNLNIKRHLKSIFYLVAVNLAIEIYSLVDVTMLSSLCKYENVAFYSYGQKVQRILIQIINSFTMVLVPRISLYYKERKYSEYNNCITKTLKVILLLSVPIIIGILFTSRYLICTIYGNQYITSSYVLNIMSLIILISPIGYLLGSRIMLVTGHENQMIIPVGVGALVNIIGNYFLIKAFNEIGAAIASVISELVVMLIYVNLGKKHVKIDANTILGTLWKEGLAIALMVSWLWSCIFMFNNEAVKTIFQILGSIVLYFGALIALKEEIITNYITRIVRRIRNDK